jgi:hypothetical protein
LVDPFVAQTEFSVGQVEILAFHCHPDALDKVQLFFVLRGTPFPDFQGLV